MTVATKEEFEVEYRAFCEERGIDCKVCTARA
jgi:hypothetical protein